MQFYRKGKDGRNYLILHTDEWNRLKRQTGPSEKPLNEQKEYVKSLNEKSRAWTKTWPDHKHGVVANYEKKLKKLRDTELAIVKSEKERQKFDKQSSSLEAIKLARQKIFDSSCYGRKLLGALHESKILEERDAQVLFMKKIKEENDIESKKFKIPACCSFDLDKHETEEKKCRKTTAIKMALTTAKEMYETQKAKAAKSKEVQQQDDLEVIQTISEMVALEQKAQEKMKLLEKEAMQQHRDDDKKRKEERSKSNADIHAKVMEIQKEKEVLNFKINTVLQEMYRAKDPTWTKQVYENLILHQEKKRKSFETLMDINNKLAINRSNEQERKNKEKEIKEREKRRLIAESNKLKSISRKEKEFMQANEFTSDRQYLIVDNNKDRIKKKQVEVGEYKALKKRIQQPPSWTGANTAHQEFARNADETLRDCKYKHPGRKVVDEYIKYNRLDSLDVHNYY